MTRRTVWRSVAAMGAVILIAGLAASWWLGSELVRPAQRRVPLPAGFPAQILTIPGPGRAIAAWWVDGGERAPAVVLAHAIRADRSSMVSRARLLGRHGFSVLLIDLQAHGETPGDAITLGWREADDVRAALTWLRRDHSMRRVGVIGSSLGGAAVVLGAQPVGFDAVVLEAVYPRVGRAIENRIRLRLGALARVLTPLLLMQIPARLHVSPSDLEPIRAIGRLGAPVLVVAGSEDRHTTLEESRELFEAAKEPKELWVVRGASHQDVLSFDQSAYESTVVAFLKRFL